MKKSRFQPNSKYFTISVYAILVFLACALIARIIFSFSSVWGALGRITGVLSPFIVGLILAYLINPLYKFLDFTFFQKWLHMTKRRGLSKVLSLLIAYVITFGIVITLIAFVIPQFVNSISTFVNNLGSYTKQIQEVINDIQNTFKNLNLTFLTEGINSFIPSLTSKLSEWAQTLMSTVVNTSISIVSGVIKAIVAIFVSVYMLSDKQRLEHSLRNLFYALFKEERAARISRIARESSTIFSNFFTGKIFDSLIIGFLCAIGMLIFRLPYVVMVSVFVGITNIIPYFGPFVGAIPSILIMLMVGWKEAIIFTILILVIQQLDGNLIGPRIIGNSTGLRPIWVLFAITVGAWVAGVGGMLFGVPVMAVIGNLVEEAVNDKLKEKGYESMILVSDNKPKTLNYSDMFRNIFKKKKGKAAETDSPETSENNAGENDENKAE